MNWSDGLEEPHLSIAASDHPRIGILAGPGTGKTTYGLMRRVVRLLEEGVPAERILLLSFTRVAAGDLRDKIEQLQAPGADGVRASTVHSYCFGLLRRDGVFQATGRVPRILLEHEQDLMLRDIGGDFGNIYARRDLLQAFVAGWARGKDDHPGSAELPSDRQFENSVIGWLKFHRAMLIGEVVPIAQKYLSTNPAVEELDAFDHVIVDEYQDLNIVEQHLLELLAGSGKLCIAGDDDQSIYSVRYANPEGIVAFTQRPDVENHSIETCGRCPEPILGSANALIANAPDREKGELVPRNPDESGAMAVVQWAGAEAEVQGLVAAIASDVANHRRESGDFLVLTTRRNIGRGIVDALNELEIPARSFFKQDQLSSDAARKSFALLRLLVDESDAPALRVLLGLGDAQGRSQAYRRLVGFCVKNNMSQREVLAKLVAEEKLDLSVRALRDRFGEAATELERLRDLSISELVEALFPEDQEETMALREIALDAIENVGSPAELYSEVLEAIIQESVPQSPDYVRVMTLHKSKGLTSPVVFIAGVVNGALPTIMDHETVIEEARRLFYVGVTRAAEELVISSALTMGLAEAKGYGVSFDNSSVRIVDGVPIVRTIASPLIAELGPSCPTPVKGEEWAANR